MIKKILIILGILIALIVGAAIALPIIYKDDIKVVAKQEINNTVNAKIDFGAFGLSLFKSFPNLTFTIDDLKAEGVGPFAGITLAQIDQFGITLDIMGVIAGNMTVKKIILDRPVINLMVLEDGTANWDVAKAGEEEVAAEEEGSGEFAFALKKYTITDGYVVYDDAATGFYTKLVGLNHSGSGDFTQDDFVLGTRTEIEALTMEYGGVNYFHKVNTDIKVDLAMNMPSSTYSFKENSFTFNGLELKLDGKVAMPGDDIDMDITFGASKTEFKNILSLVPAIFKNDFKDLETKGKMALEGNMKGIYSETNFPAFVVELVVEDGMFRYPDLPASVNNVQLDVRVANKGGDMDNTLVDVKKFHIELNQEPFDFTLGLATPLSDPNIEATMAGQMNLANLSQAVPLEGVTELAGIIKTDLEVKGRLSTLDKGQYDRFHAAGNLNIDGLKYNAEDLAAPVSIEAMHLVFNPRFVELSEFKMMAGKSDLSAEGRLDNLIGYVFRDEPLKGTVNLSSQHFDSNEWMSEEDADAEEEESDEPDLFTDKNAADLPMPENIDMTLILNMNELIYEKSNLEDITGKIRVKEGFAKGKMNVHTKYFNVDDWMEEDPEATSGESAEDEEPLSVYYVPSNVDFYLTASADKVHYDNMDMTGVNAKMRIRNETVTFEQMNAALLGGTMNMTGDYSTKGVDLPTFSFNYNIQNFDIQETFKTFNTVESLAPVAKYVDGKFSSKTSVNGTLDKEMMPDLTSLSGNGDAFVLDGVLTNFKPMVKVADALKMDQFKKMDLKDVAYRFEIKDGRIHVKPFPMRQGNIDMMVSGSNGFDETIDYTIDMAVPRKEFPSAANAVVDNLLGQAKSAGIEVGQTDNINVNVGMKGTITDPKIKTGIGKGSGGSGDSSAKDAAKAEADRLKKEAEERAKAEAERLKKEAADRAKAEKQKLLNEAERKKKEAAAKAKAEAERRKKEAEAKAKAEAERLRKEAEEKAKKEAEQKLKKLFK
jgi:uncharacterized protein involved in outer membrane biogenesis